MDRGIKTWALAIGIAVVFNLFVNYGVATFSEAPEHSDYCDEFKQAGPIFPVQKDEGCKSVDVSEELKSSCREEKGNVAFEYNATGCPKKAYCETCEREYDEARNKYNGNVFIILTLTGAAAIAAGVFIKAESVSTGFLLAGILSVIIGTMRYWSQLQNVFRLIVLGIVLAILIWLGYKKAND